MTIFKKYSGKGKIIQEHILKDQSILHSYEHLTLEVETILHIQNK